MVLAWKKGAGKVWFLWKESPQLSGRAVYPRQAAGHLQAPRWHKHFVWRVRSSTNKSALPSGIRDYNYLKQYMVCSRVHITDQGVTRCDPHNERGKQRAAQSKTCFSAAGLLREFLLWLSIVNFHCDFPRKDTKYRESQIYSSLLFSFGKDHEWRV